MTDKEAMKLALAGIAYSSYAVYWCAVFNTEKNKAAHGIKENT
jgi:hypothetical protein